jgi:hypothetical protein
MPKPNVKRIDRFTRWMAAKEAANVKAGKPGYDQWIVEHRCGTPACMGGYLLTYPPYRRWEVKNHENDANWSEYLGVSYDEVFSSIGCRISKDRRSPRSGLEAANYVRRLAKLPRLTRADLN